MNHLLWWLVLGLQSGEEAQFQVLLRNYNSYILLQNKLCPKLNGLHNNKQWLLFLWDWFSLGYWQGATWCEELTHLKRPWCWERLRAGGEGGDRGWDGWMALPTQWRWVCVTPGVGDRQGGLACCGPWGSKESDMTEWLNWTDTTVRYRVRSKVWMWKSLLW